MANWIIFIYYFVEPPTKKLWSEILQNTILGDDEKLITPPHKQSFIHTHMSVAMTIIML